MKTAMKWEKPMHRVFYSRKVLDNSTVIETTVRSEPATIEGENSEVYSFRVDLEYGDELSHDEVRGVTSVRETAEKLFDLLSSCNVFPCHLREVTEDFLVSCGS